MSICYRQQIVYIYMPSIIITLNRCHSILFTFKVLFEYISIFILKILRMGIITALNNNNTCTCDHSVYCIVRFTSKINTVLWYTLMKYWRFFDPDISNEYSKRWVDSSHTHNFWYSFIIIHTYFNIILILLTFKVWSTHPTYT